jgi:hypothetical protein
MPSYAGIGKRDLSKVEDGRIVDDIATELANAGYTLRTGAAPGTDQVMAEVALAEGGKVVLCLPSRKHEEDWVRAMMDSYPDQVTTEVLQDNDDEAFNSVEKYHPIGHKLYGYTVRLHARNYRIVVGPEGPVDFVVAFPREGGGGTAQGMRVATHKGIPLVNLGGLNEGLGMEAVRRLMKENGDD